MFIKKDLRKIPRILADASPDNDNTNDDPAERTVKRTKRETLTELRLSRRNSEFNGSLKILCQPENAPSLQHLVSLSLYDCQISSLAGIGMLASPVDGRDSCCPDLRELNVGRNPLTTLPKELATLPLKELWCDDCQLTGVLPECVTNLRELETLRVSNNKITEIPVSIRNLRNLKTLCLDGNEIVHVPSELSDLCDLQTLLLRNNKIKELPEGVPGADMTDLLMLHVSSNQLESLPNSCVECTWLEQLYANSNKLKTIPTGMADALIMLKRLTLSHNDIQELPKDFVERFGEPKAECDGDPTCVVTLASNPVLEKQQVTTTASNDNEDSNTSTPMEE